MGGGLGGGVSGSQDWLNRGRRKRGASRIRNVSPLPPCAPLNRRNVSHDKRDARAGEKGSGLSAVDIPVRRLRISLLLVPIGVRCEKPEIGRGPQRPAERADSAYTRSFLWKVGEECTAHQRKNSMGGLRNGIARGGPPFLKIGFHPTKKLKNSPNRKKIPNANQLSVSGSTRGRLKEPDDWAR